MTSPQSVASKLYDGPGFRRFGIDTVVKFGGSLLFDVKVATEVAAMLAGLPAEQTVLVFPGGGPTDKLIESISRELDFDGPTRNPACMRALDQTGILLAAMHPRLSAVEDLASARHELARGQVPVLLPGRLILALDVFTREDVITSDSLGAFFAFLVGAKRYVVLTNVDGVYDSVTGPADDRRLIEKISAEELAVRGPTSVDRCLAPFLRTVRMPTWVLDGRVPSRVAELLSGGTPIGTQIDA